MRKIAFLVATIAIYICSAGTSVAQDCPKINSLDMSIEDRASQTSCKLKQPGTLQFFKINNNQVSQLPAETFSVGDEVALCLFLPETMFVSIWDQPPSGKRERMFPNLLSHPNGEKAVRIKKNSRFCIGLPTDEYAIKVDALDGQGFGKFYLLGTNSYSQMPEKTSFEVEESQTLGMQILSRDDENQYGGASSFTEKEAEIAGFYEAFAMYKVKSGAKSIDVEYDDKGEVQNLEVPIDIKEPNQKETAFQCTEPFTKLPKTRVVGGISANPKDFPWQVGIKSSVGGASGFCGGTLIGKKWVLTAAHCFPGMTAQDGSVLPGFSASVSRANDKGAALGISRSVKKIYIHPNYIDSDELGYPNDIAVVELEKGMPVDTNDLIIIADKSIDNLFRQSNSCSTVVGWGVLDEASQTISSVMKQVNLPIVDQDSCSSSYPDNGISDTQICAGYRQGGKDSCSGDSGGPLVIRGGPAGWLQVGVVSWGEGCARPNKYGVYSKVSKYYDWVYSVMRGTK